MIEVDSSSGSDSENVDTTSSSSDESGAEYSSARGPVQQPSVPS